ncbi:MAG: ABC transporter permease subunit [Planctomycetes bacterium]|nr:ABC transporter permease subunit [Planctomycetota bacterium]
MQSVMVLTRWSGDMGSIFGDLGLYLWRLLPANPILVRVVSAGGKRTRHLMARIIYLAVLFTVMIVGQSILTSGGSASLATLAKQSSQVFMYVSITQLLMMSFIAPVFTAGAITQEKDSNTFNILLTTPLSDGQIVLGSLMSRLYFVWVLLLSGLPVFCITMIYGGVTTTEVFVSFALAASTALLTGSLAIAISVLKIGTQRTIFSYFMGIAIYLLVVFAIGLTAFGQLPASEVASGPLFNGNRMSWLAPIHPFLALFVVTGQTPAPTMGAVQHYGWPWRWMLAYPQYGYIVLTTLFSALVIALSLFAVRRATKTTDGGLLDRIKSRFTKEQGTELRQKPRHVWANPIAWREATTRGSAAGRSGMRWAFAVIGIALGFHLLLATEYGWFGMSLANAGSALTALVWIELAIILLVVTNTAAATLTRERDAGTMDLLLSTPMTSKYIIAGMLRGLVSFVIPLIVVPTVTVLIFVVRDFFRPAGQQVTTWEAFFLTPILIIVFSAFAAILGLNRSLNSRKTTQAVMTSTAIVMGLAVGSWGCIYGIARGGDAIAAVIMPLAPFPAIQALFDYQEAFATPSTADPAKLLQLRILRTVTSLVSAGIYAIIVVTLYKNMVRGFDMIVRRQQV